MSLKNAYDMAGINKKMLQTVAQGLKELKNEVVFIGGSVAELYANDPASSDIRPTHDVDCVIELSSRMAFGRLEESLRKNRLTHDTSKDAPICRWIYKNIKVDIMPDDERILGFTNKWYHEGIENKIAKTLTDGTQIFVFSPEYYLAAKFEAHKNRGGKDLRQSHDFEDIIYILDNCQEIIETVANANESVKYYLREECRKLLDNEGLAEGIECALPYHSERLEIILDLFRDIAGIE